MFSQIKKKKKKCIFTLSICNLVKTMDVLNPGWSGVLGLTLVNFCIYNFFHCLWLTFQSPSNSTKGRILYREMRNSFTPTLQTTSWAASLYHSYLSRVLRPVCAPIVTTLTLLWQHQPLLYCAADLWTTWFELWNSTNTGISFNRHSQPSVSRVLQLQIQNPVFRCRRLTVSIVLGHPI